MNVYSEDSPPPGHTFYDPADDYDAYCECGKRLEVDPPWYDYGHHLRFVVENLPNAAWDEDERVCRTCNHDAPDDGRVHAALTYAPAPEED